MIWIYIYIIVIQIIHHQIGYELDQTIKDKTITNRPSNGSQI
mgnify:CR=1 FL=1